MYQRNDKSGIFSPFQFWQNLAKTLVEDRVRDSFRATSKIGMFMMMLVVQLITAGTHKANYENTN